MSEISFSEMAGRADGQRPNWRPEDEERPGYIDHAQRARDRLAELRALHGDDFDIQSDVDESLGKWLLEAPSGWVYQWKLFSVWNKEYPNYLAALYRAGWSPVPAARHRSKLYGGYKEENIIQEGLILMERPLEWETRARLREERKTLDQIRTSELKLSDAPPNTAPRDRHPGARPWTRGHVGPVIPD